MHVVVAIGAGVRGAVQFTGVVVEAHTTGQSARVREGAVGVVVGRNEERVVLTAVETHVGARGEGQSALAENREGLGGSSLAVARREVQRELTVLRRGATELVVRGVIRDPVGQ